MTSPLAAEDPERLGDYWVAARLGSGGQGVVYEAYDRDGTRVAVKVLRREAAPFAWDRFAKEAEAARRVAPFCTARILGVSVPPKGVTAPESTVPYIVSEYIPGPALAVQVQRDGPLGPDAILRLAIGTATALAAIHSAGVIHRDLKPGNVLLSPEGPRIIDFGIAHAPDMSLTATGALMGTLGYMAPEVLSGMRATTASDIFAWGAVVLFAAGGGEPFRGSHLGEVAHRTASVNPDLGAIPSRFRPIIAAALAKDPGLRPSAQELLIGLIGGQRKAADPRRALLEAGARRAASPEAGDIPAAVSDVPLGERAESAFTALPPAHQLAAHELLLRLVSPGDAVDGSQDSVRTASRDELYAGRPESERRAIDAAVTVLAGAGVLEASEEDGSVRPVSAALPPAWQRLRDAVDADRPRLLVHRAVGHAARQWHAHGERQDDLPHGTALRTFLDWLATVPFHLRPSPVEIRFLEAARQASAGAARRRHQLLSGVAVLTVMALVAGTLAWLQSRESARRGAEAELRREQATSRSVAAIADSLRGSSPDTARLLSLAAWRTARTPEARSSLSAAAMQQATGVVNVRRTNFSHENREQLIDRGRTFTTHVKDKTELWDLTKGHEGAAEPRLTVMDGVPAADPLFSRDGQLLLKKGASDTYQVVSTRDGEPFGGPVPRRPGFQPTQLSNRGHVLFSPDSLPHGRPVDTYRMVSPGGRTVSWTAEKDSSVQLSPDGTHFTSCVGSGHPLRVWAIRPGKAAPRFVFSSAPAPSDDFGDTITCGTEVTFSTDGSALGLQDEYGFHVWSTADGRKRASLSTESAILRAQLSDSGRYVLTSTTEDPISVWALDGSSDPLFRLATSARTNDSLDQMSLDEESKTLTYLTTNTAQAHRVDLTEALSSSARGPDATGSALSADGRTFVYRDDNDPPLQHFVDARTGRESGRPLPHRPGPQESAATLRSALSPDGRMAAFTDARPSGGSVNRSVVVWDRYTRKELLRVPLPESHSAFLINVSRDNRYLVFNKDVPGLPAGEGTTLDVWDIRARKLVRRYTQSQFGFGQFSHDSRRLVTTDGDVLDLETGAGRRVRFGGDGASHLAFSPDGELLAVVRPSGWIELWDSEVRRPLARMPSSAVHGGTRAGSLILNAVFSADGDLLAATVGRESVQLWDVKARIALSQPLEMSGRTIDSLAFDGSVLRTLSLTGSRVQSVDLAPDSLEATVCAKAGRDISRQEWQTYIPDLPYRSLC
ncbi:protein kinase [Streptomyces sp. NPDC051018]|uniref:protein kinase domain-containing protein n=1 Tax=Streptomyces sp. NPDC051018 TaxID=3365639 RepID=UPI0037A76F43